MTAAPAPIPLTLVTGPAGAGKTRLINAALALPSFAGAIAIANQPGATPLASDVPADIAAEDMSACLCCGRAGAFAALLERLLRARDNRRMPAFDRLIFETSGAADPSMLAAEIIHHPYLSKRYRLTGIVLVETAPESAMAAQRAAASSQVACGGAALASAALAALFDAPFDPARLPEAARRALYRLAPRGAAGPAR